MRILITGAAGFVGTHLVTELAPRHEIVAVARMCPSRLGGADWIEVDLAQAVDTRILPGQVDAVIHLAQSRRYREFPAGAPDVFAVNIASTFALLEYARAAGAGCFVFVSSGGVYGYSYERFVEEDPVSPLGFYLRSKYSAELLIANYTAFFDTVVLRPFFIYGPGQRGMLVPGLVERVLSSERVEIQGDPGLRINPLHVSDAVRVFEPALELGRSGLFNIAGDEVLTITELVRRIGCVTGREPQITHMSAAVPGNLIGDNRQMKQVLGVTPRMNLSEGLRSVVGAIEVTSVEPRSS
jgi:nucleoside-diphosphate-sugar epimerase